MYEVTHARRRSSGLAGRLLTRLLVGVLTLVLLAIALVLQPSLLPRGIRTSLGLEQRAHVLGGGKGSYAFMEIQPGTHDMPVTYSSCQTLHYVINPAGAPSRFADGHFIRDAVKRISQVSGLKFHYDGTTDLRRRTHSYGRGPIVFSFDEVSDDSVLDGAAAVGGSASTVMEGRRYYTTGDVTFERNYFSDLSHETGGEDQARAIALHEIGHVLGLDHVHDTHEIMNASGGHLLDLGPGDETGLKILGSGPC